MAFNRKELKVEPTTKKNQNPYSKDVIVDPMGQWKYPGEITKIPSNQITMQGVPYPVLGVDDLGNEQMMYPGMNYTFPGQSVTEYPQMVRYGGLKKKRRKTNNPAVGINDLMLRNPNYHTRKGASFVPYKQDGGSTDGSYNMERALELGYKPDETEHWPSVDSETGMWLKSKEHPTAWMEYMYGQLNPEIANEYDVRVNSEGYFGDNQLQYVPKKQAGGWLDKYQTGGPKIDRSLMGEPNYAKDETAKVLPSKYKAQEQAKQAGKLAQEGAAETLYNEHLQRQELKKKYPGKRDENIKAIQEKINNPWFNEPSGQIASYLTRGEGLSEDELASITGDGSMGSRLGIAAEMGAWGLGNEVGGKLIGDLLGTGINKLSKLKKLPGSPNPITSVDDVSKGIKQSSNKIDQTIIDDYTKREIDWLNSEEYIKRNMAATGKTREAVMQETEKIIKQVDKTKLNVLDDKADMAAGVYVQDKNNPVINLFNTGNKKWLLNAADHEIKHAASQQAIRSTDGLVDLVTNPYKKYPTINVKKWYDNFIPGETITKWSSNAPEQQVVSRKIMDLVEKTQGVKRGTQLTDDNIKGVIDLLNKDIKAKNPADTDIIGMMHSFKSKFGKDYYKQIKEMANKAYIVPTVMGIGAAGTAEALSEKKDGGSYKGWLDKYNK